MVHFDLSPSQTGFSIFKNKQRCIHCIYQLIIGLPFPSISGSPSIRFTAFHALRQQIFFRNHISPCIIQKIIPLASRCCSDICNRQTSTAEVLPGNSLSPVSLEHVCFLIMADVHFQPLYNPLPHLPLPHKSDYIQ